MNYSRYTITHSEHPLLDLLNRYYPGYLNVEVISDGETSRIQLSDIKTKNFPLIVEIACSVVYSFYHCLPQKQALTENEDLNFLPSDYIIGDQIKAFINKRIQLDRNQEILSEKFDHQLSLERLNRILRNIAEISRIGFIDGKFLYWCGNNSRSYF